MSITTKSVIIDIANGWGAAEVNIRSVDFWLNGSLIPMTSGFLAYATTMYPGFYPSQAFDTSLSKLGTITGKSWNSLSVNSNQRVIVVFDTPLEFDQIIVNNCHHLGGYTNQGVKDTVITVSDDAITDVTYNNPISNSEIIFDGEIAQHTSSDTEDPELVWEGVVKTTLTSILRQPYDDGSYGIVSILRQPYGDSFISILRQTYGDKGLLLSALRQPYGDKNLLLSRLRQPYRDKNLLLSRLRQPYDIKEALLSTLRQPYSINGEVGVSALRQRYDILDVDVLLSVLRQRYSIAPDAVESVGGLPSSITISDAVIVPGEGVPSTPGPSTEIGFGERDGVSATTIDYDIDTYCGVFTLGLTSEQLFETFTHLSEVVVTLDGIAHRSIVTGRSTEDSFGNRTFKIESRSPSVLLDYPYARKITDDFVVSGVASAVINDIAAIENFTITWHMDSDPPQTSSTYDVIGEYPLQAIRSLVNELGGKIQSHPDGSIHIIKRQPVDSDKYDAAVVETTISTLDGFESVATESDERSGSNSFTVSNESIDTDYTLETDGETGSNVVVKAYKVPWVSSAVELVTSELTNISISEQGIVTETVTQENVEIIEGVGTVDLPCYGSITYDYGTRTNLGAVEITESGAVSSDVAGNTLVNITYETKYWAWSTTDTDPETVQFILFTVV